MIDLIWRNNASNRYFRAHCVQWMAAVLAFEGKLNSRCTKWQVSSDATKILYKLSTLWGNCQIYFDFKDWPPTGKLQVFRFFQNQTKFIVSDRLCREYLFCIEKKYQKSPCIFNIHVKNLEFRILLWRGENRLFFNTDSI